MGFLNNEENTRTLNKILKHAKKGFFVFTTKTPAMQYEAMRGLDLEAVCVFDWSKDKKRYSYIDLLELMEENYGFDKFVIPNFHFALQSENDILNLNLSRDVLANHEKLWIFGMTEDMDAEVAKTAIDFYSCVMMKVRFKEESPEIGRPEIRADGNAVFDKELAYALIRDYERLIADSTGKFPELVAQAYDNMAELCNKIAEYAKASEYHKKAAEIRDKQGWR